MSKLKEHQFCESDEFSHEYPGPLSNELRLYYLKSEADAVIAELKAQKAQAEDDCAYWKMNEGNAANAMHETEEYAMQLYKEAQHHKYKRCLAMAGLCSSYRFAWSFIPEDDEVHKSNFYKKWELRWLELAEKFK
jgi:hypothetical protein